jgi:hypothetical protein
MKKLFAYAAFATLALAVEAPEASAQTLPPQVTLTLINGWVGAPFGTRLAKVELLSGVVRLKGAIANGSASTAFVLPAGYRPATNVYVPVDMCNATNGRLFIQPNGTVSVQAETSFSNAQCFTSLDGASFDKNTTIFTPLALVNGWSGAPFGAAPATFRGISGYVQFKGAIAGGTSSQAFTLPVGSRPGKSVYVPIDLCNATNGRLIIQPTGVVTVQAETSFSNAQCFTSLDGASFPPSAAGATLLTPINGWTNGPFSTRNVGVRNISGVVHFTGSIGTTGSNPVPFILPTGFRPGKNVYIKVDLCNATNGRLFIQPNGVVTVQAASFANAQCFTSLEGASFVL